MVRRTRIVLCASLLAMFASGALLTPAIGDQHLVPTQAKVSYTEDGVPYVRSGPQGGGEAAARGGA